MAKFYGNIGYVVTKETVPGVWKEEVTSRPYYGDITRNVRRIQNAGVVNDDLVISNTIRVVADPFAMENFHAIRYVEFMGTKWKASDVEVRYPRLVITLGGVYNG